MGNGRVREHALHVGLRQRDDDADEHRQIAITQNIGRQSQRNPPRATYMIRSIAPNAATFTQAAIKLVIDVGDPLVHVGCPLVEGNSGNL